MTKKLKNKYADLLEYSSTNIKEVEPDKFKSLFYVHDDTKSIISTDGARLLARRDIYDEVKTLARIVSADKNVLFYNESGLLEAANPSKEMPDYTSIMPTKEKLKKDYRKVELAVPEWLSRISKKAKKAYCSVVLRDVPIIAVNTDYGKDSIPIDGRYLKAFAGQRIKAYVPINGTSPFLFLPLDQELDNATWFALVMPCKRGSDDANKYLK